jgi:hypothetical protein
MDVQLREGVAGYVDLYSDAYYTPPADWNKNLNVYLMESRAYVEAGGGTYPAVADVDSTAPTYGTTGTEYQGTLLQPAVTNVKTGVQYGGGGTEFTGTYSGGGGLSQGTVLLDALTGDRYIYLNGRLILSV